ncbi:hypothetical protein PUN28_014080 [Cardiocondyla obscurior]|uniref:Uncharacterized protein n=1 Tax=Cardiocondyla obscurior TaxID=286306 RepID=A0AAW2F4C0_9HYME
MRPCVYPCIVIVINRKIFYVIRQRYSLRDTRVNSLKYRLVAFNDNASGSKILDVVVANTVNNVDDSSENISERLHRIDTQVPDKADHLKIQ